MKKPAFAGLSPQCQGGQATIYYGSVVDHTILALLLSVKQAQTSLIDANKALQTIL